MLLIWGVSGSAARAMMTSSAIVMFSLGKEARTVEVLQFSGISSYG